MDRARLHPDARAILAARVFIRAYRYDREVTVRLEAR